jgi:heterodisulfide reductase subunit A
MMENGRADGTVLVVGGGVAGLQAALDLAEAGVSVFLVEKESTIGGSMAKLDKTFPFNDCSMCILAPKLVEGGRHQNIELLTLCEVTAIEGSAGNFQVTVRQKPRYVDSGKCIACGLCSEVCPKTVEGKVHSIFGKRQAIDIDYPQAVPLSHRIDAANCLRLKKPGTCGHCLTVCDAGAINFADGETVHTLNVGAIILAPGFSPFDPGPTALWGYGRYANVITSLELEQFFTASTLIGGQLKRPSDGKSVSKIAFLQCVGSRDEKLAGKGYCSSVCCMTSIKGAMLAKEHEPGVQAAIFYQDMRTHGKGFDQYLERARQESGIRFIRCRMGGLESDAENGDLRLRYVNEEGRQIEEYFDLAVLAVGLQIARGVKELAQLADVRLTGDGFAAASDFQPVISSREGVFVCGAFAGPKDIPQSVIEGSAAAAAVAGLLAHGRKASTGIALVEEERSLPQNDTRIGILICHCGINIAGVVDIKAVANYAKTLPDVVSVGSSQFACAQNSQSAIVRMIEEQSLNRMVIAACTPRTHEALFRRTLKLAGLNEDLMEMANIRNHDAWVHGDNPLGATAKAKDLLRMAAAKVTYAIPSSRQTVAISQQGLVIGGGVSGMTAALNLADQGFIVHLVEKARVLGGNARHFKNTWGGEHVRPQLQKLIEKVQSHQRVLLHLEATVVAVEGFVGNFRSTVVDNAGKKAVIDHGTTIIALGGEAAVVEDYGHGSMQRVVTSQQFDKLYELKEKHVKAAKRFAFIQCVGSREEGHPYCSKVCCTHSVQSAIALKKENPERSVYILYRDLRTYGKREGLFREARRLGVIFINYELHGKPLVEQNGQELAVGVWDHILHTPLKLIVDMVILAVAIRPGQDALAVARLYKVPLDGNGFIQEAHAKLRPVDCIADGVFVAGLVHYPKPLEESVAQALGAAARAAAILARPEMQLDTVKAVVDENFCDGCALCIDVCPYQAISLVDYRRDNEEVVKKMVRVNLTLCKGCGICQGTCPTRGIGVAGFTRQQFTAQLQAALAA